MRRSRRRVIHERLKQTAQLLLFAAAVGWLNLWLLRQLFDGPPLPPR